MPPDPVKSRLIRQDSLSEKFQADKLGVLTTVSGDTLSVPVVKGDLSSLPQNVQQFIASHVKLCSPKALYVCDGSAQEGQDITDKLLTRGTLIKLNKYDNSYLCRTDPADVARVEGKTFIVSEKEHDSVPHVREGVTGILGKWMSPEKMEVELESRFSGCMEGRVMYVIPFSMGPVGSLLSKVGVQLTDCNYVVLSMRIMTRVAPTIWELIHEGAEYIQCVHSLGAPRPVTRPIVSHWPCDRERVLIAHFPLERRILSYGSGYGGNSLLGKKCFALRIASCVARDEGWLAEHMLIMGVTNPAGQERFVAAAFPSSCGKTNMAMMTPCLPGWKVRVIGDDIAWMRFDDEGRLKAINPEAGFFGVAPGTSRKTNPVAMDTIFKNTIFTNTAMTEDGGVFWEGMEKEVDKNVAIKTWLGAPWKVGDAGVAAHPNSRFCTPAGQCPAIHPMWESPEGVPIDAIIWGGRRPVGVPLVVEARNWEHGVMMGAALKSETTAAAEFKAYQIMHDPMAMRPFFGYNFGQYLQHWLSLDKPGRKLPLIAHVNWFRLDEQRRFLWPGFGENIRVLDWIFRRIDGEDIAVDTPIGLIPKKGSLNMDGLKNVDWEQLMSVPKDYWTQDAVETMNFLDDQVGQDLPDAIRSQLRQQQENIHNM